MVVFFWLYERRNMNKILKTCLFATIGIIGSMFSLTDVHAQDNLQIKYLDNIYYVQHSNVDSSDYRSYKAGMFYVDGKLAYCFEPGTSITSHEYATSDWSVANLTASQRHYIEMVGYYGYEYSNHQASKYYLATQELIWESVKDIRVYWTTEQYGNGSEINVDAEKNEILSLIAQHDNRPSFNGNTLSIKVNATGEDQIRLVRSHYDNDVNLVYYSGNSQKLVHTRISDPVVSAINIKSVAGKVTTNKVDADTGIDTPQGEATLTGAIYDIFDETNTYITSITTGADSNGTSINLPRLGKYYLLERTPSTGYQLDTTKYWFEMTLDNLYPTIKVYEKVINRDFDFTKVYADAKTGILTPEANIEFGFYDYKGNLYKTATTDSNGRIFINLPYGKYKVKQLTSTTNYEKVDDFEVEVYDMGDTTYKVIANAEITAKLKVVKIDKNTGDSIARGGIKSKIFDIDRNEYVTQTITYPTPQTISIFETSSDGILLTPYALKSGHYRLEEVDQVIDGYLWNDISVDFEIGENSEFINGNEYGILFEVKFENKEVKGQVDLTKYGEELTIENGSYHYNKILLSGVVYELYASEDIYSANGILMYKKGTLIATDKTSEKGLLSFKNLYLGKYYLLERSSSNNNVVDTTKHYFELTYKDQYTAVIINEIQLENHLPKGTLDFTKTDLVTGDAISNTKIEIYTENDELIYTGYTDEFGKITITDLFSGKFYIIETEASTGYQITTDKVYFEITEDGEIVKANMTNEQIVKVPNTGISDSKVFNIITLILIIAGAGFIIYDKTKKK